MTLETTQVIAVTVYKLVSLGAGTFICYLGYRLFVAGIWGNAGDAEGAFGDLKIVVRKAAPGSFFAMLGAVVVCATISTGLTFSLNASTGETGEKPYISDD